MTLVSKPSICPNYNISATSRTRWNKGVRFPFLSYLLGEGPSRFFQKRIPPLDQSLTVRPSKSLPKPNFRKPDRNFQPPSFFMAYVLGGIPGPLTVEFLKVYRGPFIIIISLLVGGGYTPQANVKLLVRSSWRSLPSSRRPRSSDRPRPGTSAVTIFWRRHFFSRKKTKNTCFTLLNTRKRMWVWFL